jgi:hypothetical protein
MSSALLALFDRSLREDTRSKIVYRVRSIVGTILLLLLFGFAIAASWSGAPGRNFFISIVILQAVSITAIGLSYFASAVTEEKEEQMLGLLRMTNLNPISILLGKSTSRLCSALLLLAAQIPFTVFAVTLGGISLGQIAATYCTLAAYTFLLCNIALLGSVIARQTTGAVTFSVFILALFLAGAPLLSVMAEDGPLEGTALAQPVLTFSEWWRDATPTVRLNEVLDVKFTGAPAGWQVVSNTAGGVVFFLLAWVMFERFCDRAAAGTVNTGAMARLTAGARAKRPPRPTKDAVTWKDFYFVCGGWKGVIGRVLLYAGTHAVILIGVHFFQWDRNLNRVLLYLGVPAIFSIDFAATTARVFRKELQDKTLSTLAVIPFTMKEIVARKVRACLICAVPGTICLAAWSVFALGSGNTDFVSAVVTLSIWFVILLLVHVAARFSLTMKYAALPVSFVVTVVAYALIAGMYGPWGACIASFVIVAHLHQEVPRRLEALAGEG